MREPKPLERLPRPIDELDQWIWACKGAESADASFERVRPFAETVCLGAIALRVGPEIEMGCRKYAVHEFAASK